MRKKKGKKGSSDACLMLVCLQGRVINMIRALTELSAVLQSVEVQAAAARLRKERGEPADAFEPMGMKMSLMDIKIRAKSLMSPANAREICEVVYRLAPLLGQEVVEEARDKQPASRNDH